MEDRLLAASLRSRDPAAVGAVYDEYASRLYAYCWLRLRNGDAAQLAFRDTMMCAEAHIRELRAPAKFGPWLYAFARIECRRRSPAGPVMPDLPIAHHGQDDADLRLMAWQAINALPSLSRELLDLRYRQELAEYDIALVIGLPTREVTELLSEARVLLEAALIAEVLAHEGPFACPDRVAILRRTQTPERPARRPRLPAITSRRPTAEPPTPSATPHSPAARPPAAHRSPPASAEPDATLSTKPRSHLPAAQAPASALGEPEAARAPTLPTTPPSRPPGAHRSPPASGEPGTRRSTTPRHARTDGQDEVPGGRTGIVGDQGPIPGDETGPRSVTPVRRPGAAEERRMMLIRGPGETDGWRVTSPPRPERTNEPGATPGNGPNETDDRSLSAARGSGEADEHPASGFGPGETGGRRVRPNGSEMRGALADGGGAGEIDDDQREMLVRHSLECRVCSRHLPDAISPAKVYSLLPEAEPPAELRARVMSCFADPEMAGYRLFASARVSAFGTQGFPRQPGAGRGYGRHRGPRRWPRAVAALAGALIASMTASAVCGWFGEEASRENGGIFIGPPDARVPLPSPTPPVSRAVARPISATFPIGSHVPESVMAEAVPVRPTPGPVTGRLSVSPGNLTLGRHGTGALFLHAPAGGVTWHARTTGPVRMGAGSGDLASGATEIVGVQALSHRPGTAEITFEPGTVRVVVSWATPPPKTPPPESPPPTTPAPPSTTPTEPPTSPPPSTPPPSTAPPPTPTASSAQPQPSNPPPQPSTAPQPAPDTQARPPAPKPTASGVAPGPPSREPG